MRILHIVDDLRPIGGVQTYLRRLVPALARAGHESVVHAGVLAPLPGTAGVAELDADPGGAGRAARAARPDLVLVHTVDSASLVSQLTGVAPTVVFEHDYRHISPGNSRFFVRSERFCAGGFGLRCLVKPYTERCNNRRPDRVAGSIGRVLAWRRVWPRLAGVLCASDFVERLLIAEGVSGSSTHVVGYPVDIPQLPVGAATGRRDVLYVGRITPAKGIHHLVRAFAMVHAAHGDARLLVAGGPDPAQVEALARQAGVGDAVDVLGWLDDPGLRAAYECARVVAFPSLWPEPFGMAGPEAMASGVPVVASDTGGVSSWLATGRGGRLVPPGDEATLADALDDFLSDAELADREGAAGRDWVARELTIDRHLERLLPILEGAAA